MHNQLRDKPKEKVSENSPRKAEACPVVSVLQILQAIFNFKGDITPEILFVEYLNRNLRLALVSCSIALSAKVEIMLHRPTW
jgi:hypothetical protein